MKPSENVKTVADLYVEPVAFKMGIQMMFKDRVASYASVKEEDHQV